MRRPRRACAAGRSGRAARAFGNGTARLRFLRDASPGVAIDRPRFPPRRRHPPRPRRLLRRHRAAPDPAMASHGDECRLSAAQRREPPAQHAARQAFPHGHLSLPAGRARPSLAGSPTAARALARAFPGTVVMGFGLFSLRERGREPPGPRDHRVTETVPRSQWTQRDMAFPIPATAMRVGGRRLWRKRRARSP